MSKFTEKHPILTAIIISLISTSIYALLFESVIKKIATLEIEMQLFFNKDKPITVSINIISIIFVVLLIIGIIIYLSNAFIKKRILHTLPNDNYCQSCSNISELNKKLGEQQKQLKKLNDDFQKALPYKELTDKLTEYFKDNDVLESIQLFSSLPLPPVDPLNENGDINIPLKFIHGLAKNSSNINVLFNINYVFTHSIYNEIKSLFDEYNAYYSYDTKQRNLRKEAYIKSEVLKIHDILSQYLNAPQNIEELCDSHYSSYKILELVTNMSVGEDSIVECTKLLKNDVIEEQLKHGQRNGMLGTIFTQKLYCFYNENSRTKKDRIYFSVPLEHKGKHLILLGVCNKQNLRISKNCDYRKCCEQIYEEIKNLLQQKGGNRNGINYKRKSS